MTPGTFAGHSLRELTPKTNFAATGSGPRVLLAYEDFAMGLRAFDVFTSIAREAGAGGETQISMWHFDSFQHPERRETAALEAERKDIIIVALRHGRELPAQVTSWIEQWSRCRKPHDGALVAIFDSSAPRETERSDAAVRLQAVAESAGLDFFCGGSVRAGSDPTPGELVFFVPGAPGDGAEDWMDARGSLPGWGIND